MLRVVAHTSAAAAQQYYAKGLRREDYYSEGQELAGKWYGKAAARLGLSGSVTPEGFAALVENRHPGTGERLTARTKSQPHGWLRLKLSCAKKSLPSSRPDWRQGVGWRVPRSGRGNHGGD